MYYFKSKAVAIAQLHTIDFQSHQNGGYNVLFIAKKWEYYRIIALLFRSLLPEGIIFILIQ